MVLWLTGAGAAGALPPLAQKADVVLLDDAERIANCRAQLGHDRVHFLAPACQPRHNNPLNTPRNDDTGAADLLPDLTSEEIADAGLFAVNSTLTQGNSTTIATALPGAMAAGRIAVGCYSRGHRLLFGDLLISSDSAQERVRRWQQDIAPRAGHIRQAMLRKVLEQHCWKHRLARIAALAGVPCERADPPVVRVLAHAETEEEAATIQAHFTRQIAHGATMTIVLTPAAQSAAPALDLAGIKWLTQEAAAARDLAEFVSAREWLAVFRPQDYYGPNYLRDLALATEFAPASALGKGAPFRVEADGLHAPSDNTAWAPVQSLPPSAAVIRGDALPRTLSIAKAAHGDWTMAETGEKAALTLDPYSFCHNGSDAMGQAKPGVAEAVDTPDEVQCGLDMGELERWSDQAVAEPDRPLPEQLDGAALARGVTPPADGKLALNTIGTAWEITSTLEPGVHRYLFEDSPRPLPSNIHSKPLAFHLESEGDAPLLWAVLFFDANGARIGDAVIAANTNGEAKVPEGAVSIQYGIRLRGPGIVRIERVYLGQRRPRVAAPLPSANETLLISNQYPSYGAFYRNGFVHRRVRGYQAHARNVDVFRLLRDQDLAQAEFENVDYTTGSGAQLGRLLDSKQHQRVLVHFLTPEIWDRLQPAMSRFDRVTVWVHGADIQAWWHRPHDHPTEAERARAMTASDARQSFWRGILGDMPDNLHLVFVSDYLAQQSMEDLGITLSPQQYSVIHNPIDTALFAYHPKPVEQRRRILSIRPYTAPTYANDLSVRAILALRDHPAFDQLSFHIIGDGPLFDKTVEPLRELANVQLEKRFVAQTEIARLHREAGIFLCPSRMDTQGVSRDEAMSSGLVPVTNRVAAIPEFVDDTCGCLAPPDDADALAKSIAALQDDPDLFSRLSREAAARVRRQSAMEQVITRELSFVDP
ncbi:glycosyltransferase [Rhodobacteraceae bacterium D3-12]|nr:glycosyltransferase [Rhodobacteraceae bacterium D3-12]